MVDTLGGKLAQKRRDTSVVRGRLTQRLVGSMLKPGKYHDKSNLGLFLHVRSGGSKQYVQRVMIDGKRREIGLGSHPFLTLNEAREAALTNKKNILSGSNPLEEKELLKKRPTFAEAADIILKSIEATASPRYLSQFKGNLNRHINPEIGSIRIDKISNPQIIKLVDSISARSPSTAKSVKVCMNRVFNWSVGMGFISVNPVIVSSQSFAKVVTTINHWVSLHHTECHDFLTKLRASDGWVGIKLALEFIVLTATRSSETRRARWKEIDWNAGIWTVPPNQIKGRKQVVIPLSNRSLEILREMRSNSNRISPEDVIFGSERKGGEINRKLLSEYVKKDLNFAVDVHGFRTSFRVWGQELTDFSEESLELALSHSPGGSVRNAYARSSLLRERYQISCNWDKFLSAPPNEFTKVQDFDVSSDLEDFIIRYTKPDKPKIPRLL